MTTDPQSQSTRRRARVGTIFWGAILVTIAVFALIVLLGGSLDATAILWSVVGFGGLLVLAAIITAIIRSVRDQEPDHPPTG